MNTRILRANLLLFITALIWGTAFVFQRVAAGMLGTFTFNALRFFLGALSMVPLILLLPRQVMEGLVQKRRHAFQKALVPGIFAGLVLFAGAALQQVGLTGTTAGKAAFITGLYIVLVPLAGLFFRHKPGLPTWLGALLATAGLWFLSVTSDFTMSPWDFWVLVGAFFWTAHILMIGHYTQKVSVLHLALIQYLVTGLLSLGVAVFTEPWNPQGIVESTGPILFGGFISVGLAFTLQIFGQKDSPPAAASLILSLETVFAALAGAWILGEYLGVRELFGCALMLAGMALAQIPSRKSSSRL